MVDWLHCNLCFTQPGTGAKFSLTSCGHIYCEKCRDTGCKEPCRMCGANCTTVCLSANMKPEVETFFTDPADIVNKSLRQSMQVLDFQKNHRRRMLSYYKDKLAKQQEMLNKAQQCISQYKQLERELIKLREENSYLKRLMSEKGFGNHPRPGSSQAGGRSGTVSSPGSYRASPTRSPNHMTSPYHTRIVQMSSSQPQIQMNNSYHQPIRETLPMITSERISVRTPPTGGRIVSSQTTPHTEIHSNTPRSVPHPISLPSPSPKLMSRE